MRILITGGVKSGKSNRALIISNTFTEQKYFLATATAFDEEMKDRIKRHKAERGNNFITIEETINIDKFVRNNMIIDCIPMWLNNIFYSHMENQWENILNNFIQKWPENCIVVTNEIGLGIIPNDPLSRQYEIALGRANVMLAQHADRVELMVCGLPLQIK